MKHSLSLSLNQYTFCWRFTDIVAPVNITAAIATALIFKNWLIFIVMVFLYIKKDYLKNFRNLPEKYDWLGKIISYTHRLTNLVVPKYPILHILKQIVVNKFILEFRIVRQLSTV